MGFRTWLARRGIRGIAKSMCGVYKQGKAMHPDLDEAQLCQDVIGSRYQAIPPGPKEQTIISEGIEHVSDLYSACLLVVRAETGLNYADDPSLMRDIVRIVRQEVDRFLKR